MSNRPEIWLTIETSLGFDPVVKLHATKALAEKSAVETLVRQGGWTRDVAAKTVAAGREALVRDDGDGWIIRVEQGTWGADR